MYSGNGFAPLATRFALILATILCVAFMAALRCETFMPGGNGTFGRNKVLSTTTPDAFASGAYAAATNCGNGQPNALPSESRMSIEKFSRPFSRPERY